MTDKNGREIKTGDLVKRCGFVRMADGMRYKVSKNTWKISKVEDDKLYFESRFLDVRGNEVVEDKHLPRPKHEGDFLVVGDENGAFPDFLGEIEAIAVSAGSVEEKYRILKDVPECNWKVGEIVSITGKVGFATLEGGWLEKVDKDTPHKHVRIVVDPIQINNKLNKN